MGSYEFLEVPFIYSLSCVAQMIALAADSELAVLINAVVLGADLLLLVPSVGKGVRAWEI